MQWLVWHLLHPARGHTCRYTLIHTNAHIEKYRYRGRFMHTYSLKNMHFENRNTLTLSRDVFSLSATQAKHHTFNTIPELKLAEWLQTWGGGKDRLYSKVGDFLLLIPAVQNYHTWDIQLKVKSPHKTIHIPHFSLHLFAVVFCTFDDNLASDVSACD